MLTDIYPTYPKAEIHDCLYIERLCSKYKSSRYTEGRYIYVLYRWKINMGPLAEAAHEISSGPHKLFLSKIWWDKTEYSIFFKLKIGGMHSDARFLATRVLINTGFTKSNSCSPISFKENESNINKTNPRGEKT